ncbi:MAG: HdeD family acid-resistance protein [Bacteroidota bacterium]
MDNLRFTNPWFLGIQGTIMIIFGTIALVNPELTLKAIVQFFGLLLLIAGIFLVLITKSKYKEMPDFWFYEGIVNIIIGLLFLVFPSFVVNVFVIILGILALLIGIINLNFIIKTKPYFFWLSIIRNIILIAFGLLFLLVPFQGAVVIINIIGFVALFYGIVTSITAYKFFQLNQ